MKKFKYFFYLNELVGVILFLSGVIFIFNFRQFPYADDWIYVNPLNFVTTTEFIEWLFSQHVDHRIPIQKLVQFTAAYLFGYDFRVLILINLVIALLTSIILIRVAIAFRGRGEWGDLLIPLILMNPASTYAIWAFQLQFLLSIFFISTYLYYLTYYMKYKNIKYFYISKIALFLCSFTGINGLIFSSVILIFHFFYLINNKYLDIYAKILTLFLIFINCILLLSWTPSKAVINTFDFEKIINVFLNMLISNMSVFSFDKAIWKEIIIVILILLTMIYSYKNIKCNILFYGLIATLISTLIVILSISLGRGGREDWGGGLMMHYSLLTLFIPISCWIIISKDNILKYFCFPLVVIYASSFYQGYIWRLNYEIKNYEMLDNITKEIRANKNIKLIVDENPLIFTWSSTNEAKALVSDGLLTLRISGLRIYNINGK